MYALPWPPQLRARSVSFAMDSPSRSGGRSLAGIEQIVASGVGLWRASLDIAVRREHEALAWRALLAGLQGRAGTVLVPTRQAYRPVDRNGSPLSPCDVAGYGGGSFNFDLSGFGQGALTHATLASPAALGATQIAVTLVNGDGPRPGHYFGIGERLYLVSAVWRETTAGPTQVRFWPRLREAAPAGERVILDRPVCLMRLAEDASGAATLDLGRFADVSLSFVEDV